MVTTRRSRRRGPHPVYVVIAMLIALVVFAHYLPATEAVLLGVGGGLIAGVIAGYHRGKANAVPIPARKPARKPAATQAARKTPRVKYTNRDPDAILAEMGNWSSACLDGRCGECSGTFDGRKCTHCNHPGARRVPGEDPDLDEEIPY